MCGIAGIVAQSSRNIDYNDVLQTLSETLRHRGRDGEGFFVLDDHNCGVPLAGSNTTENVLRSSLPFTPKNFIKNHNSNIKFGFLHRRLALVDTSEYGHQPLYYDEGAYWLTFNGEIYNYLSIRLLLEKKGCHFLTNTDSEIILAAYKVWGTGCLEYFNGMFSFVLYDAKKQILFGARDRFGVKPFYYTAQADYWAFASEQKALLQLPYFEKKLAHQAVFDYLTMAQIDSTPQGFFEGITELPPAHFFIYNLKTHHFEQTKYYNLEYNKEYGQFDAKKAAEIVENTQNMLIESVNLRLQAAVEVGASLSGGIDSSAIVGIAQHCQPEQKRQVFTACYPNDARDERKWAQYVVEKNGCIWHKNEPNLEDLVAQIDAVNYANDEPCTATNSFSHFDVMRSVQQAGIKIVLDGQGADELFGGYPPHFNAATRSALQNRAFFDWKSNVFSGGDSSFANGRGSLASALKTSLSSFAPNVFEAMLRRKDPAFRLLEAGFWAQNKGRLSSAKNEIPAHLNALLQHDFTGNTLKVLLHTSDRFAMWHSVESRVPFTDDHRLAEYIMAQPAAYKIRDGRSKILLREAAKPFLPAEIYQRTDKIGYASPEKQWLLAHAEHWKTYLSDDMNAFYDVAFLKKNWTMLVQHTAVGETHKLWRMLNLAIWRKVFDL